MNVICGRFDREGGAMFPSPAVDIAKLGRSVIANHYARWRSRVRGMPEFGGLLPAAVMAEEMETPGEGQMRAFVTIAGNPVLSTPNGERLAKAMSGLDYMVSIDYYLNETTRHASLILPPMHALERSHYDLVFHTLAVRNTVKYSERVVEPPTTARDDFYILYELAMRLGGVRFGHPVLDRLARIAWKRGMSIKPDQILDLALRLGPYGDRFLPGRGLNLNKLREAPHGIDLGPMKPSAKERVHTKDGRVDLVPPVFLPEIERVERWLADGARAEIVLIGRRHLRTNNSWMHNVRSLVKGPDRSQLLMNREDARRMQLREGQSVRVQSRVGVVTTRLALTDDIMPGVVSLPHGYGHASAASTMKIAGATPGPNVNAITDDLFIEPILGTAILNGVPVKVEAVEASVAAGEAIAETAE
jgi:anaerobic selenocysteine-containing dehydrogenase